MPGPDRKRRLTAFVVAMAVLIVTPLAVVASDRFNDVPDSNIFHDDIAWLADNDVTRGCNPPDNDEFCPSDNVTRQQMAAFMRRLAENEVVNAATANEADDAGMLDGQDGTAYQNIRAASACNINTAGTATSCGPNADGSVPDQTSIELLSANVSTPTGGTLFLTASRLGNVTSWVTLASSCAPYVSPFLEIIQQAVPGMLFGGSTALQGTGVGAAQVPAGDHTARLCMVYESTDGGGGVQIANLSVDWTEGGTVQLAGTSSEGNAPLMGDSILGR